MPVLSRTIVWIRLTPSSVAASLMRMLCLAPSPVPTATAVGVARPSASGQAMTTAEIANVSAVRNGTSARNVHARNVSDSGRDRDDDENCGGLVGNALTRRFGILRTLDESGDLREDSFVADVHRLHRDGAADIDASADE